MTVQRYKISPSDKAIIQLISPVDLKKAKIIFLDFKMGDPVRAYFEDETHVVVECAFNGAEIEIFE